MTPQELARELGISPAALRAWLRRRYPRAAGTQGRRWHLSAEQIAAARTRWPQRSHKPPRVRALRLPVASLYAAHSRRSRHRGRPVGRHLAAIGIVLGLIAAVLAGIGYAGMAAFRSSCSLASERAIELGSNSFVYAANGSPLGMIPAVRRRQPVTLAQMSPWLAKATVAIEDRRFWQHGALDYKAIVRAAIVDVAAGRVVQGGSTITEQLVRNLYLGTTKPMSLEGKVDEACLAVQLGSVWPRQRILAAYLNQIYYGNDAFGAQAASEVYFPPGPQADAPPGGAPRRAAAGSVGLRPLPETQARAGAAHRGACRHVLERRHVGRPLRGGAARPARAQARRCSRPAP